MLFLQNTFTSTVLHSNAEATHIMVHMLTVYGVLEEPKNVTVNGKETPFTYLKNQVTNCCIWTRDRHEAPLLVPSCC